MILENTNNNLPILSPGVVFNKLENEQEYNLLIEKLRSKNISISELNEFFFYPEDDYNLTIEMRPQPHSDKLVISSGIYNSIEGAKQEALLNTDTVFSLHNLDEFAHSSIREEINQKSESLVLNFLIPKNGWQDYNGGKLNKINKRDILGTDKPIIGLDLAGIDLENISALRSEWSKIEKAETIDKYISFFALNTPLIDIPIQVHIIRSGGDLNG